MIETAVLDRLATKFVVGDGCWEWTAARNPKGYGLFRTGERQRIAHRLVYELLVGPIPEGLELDHLCRNRACVRPAHLEPVTHAENVRRSVNGSGDRHNHLKTHCPEGHPYSGGNLYERPRGGRDCRECHRVRNREWHRRRAAK